MARARGAWLFTLPEDPGVVDPRDRTRARRAADGVAVSLVAVVVAFDAALGVAYATALPVPAPVRWPALVPLPGLARDRGTR